MKRGHLIPLRHKIGKSGHKHDPDLLVVLTDPLRQCDSIHLLHLDIQDEEMPYFILLVGKPEGLRAIEQPDGCGDSRLLGPLLRQPSQVIPLGGVIVADSNIHLHGALASNTCSFILYAKAGNSDIKLSAILSWRPAAGNDKKPAEILFRQRPYRTCNSPKKTA
ncbi:hypothetical protein D3C75_700830 [compost metagenome]